MIASHDGLTSQQATEIRLAEIAGWAFGRTGEQWTATRERGPMLAAEDVELVLAAIVGVEEETATAYGEMCGEELAEVGAGSVGRPSRGRSREHLTGKR